MTRLLESLNLANYCAAFEENRIDGPTLMNCKIEEDVVELGIPLIAKARVLFNEISGLTTFDESAIDDADGDSVVDGNGDADGDGDGDDRIRYYHSTHSTTKRYHLK